MPILPLPACLRTAHPLWQCGFRPFFLGASLLAGALMLAWGLFLGLGLPVLPPAALALPAGPFGWHAQGLLFGFGFAAVAGFVLVAVPEFTATPAFAARHSRALAGCWLTGVLASGVAHPGAVLLTAGAWGGLLGGLLVLVLPRLWADPGRPQLAFAWGIASLLVTALGHQADLLRGLPPQRWLHACVGLMMILVVVALSRISMRIVNLAIEEYHASHAVLDSGADAEDADALEGRHPVYLARPPRRRLAILAIGAFTLAEFIEPGSRVGAWLALAAGAAVLNLMGDWHVGRALLRRWPLMLYAVYGLMAAGYIAMGVSMLGGLAPWLGAGRHLLTVGAFGLSIYCVICIAGRNHSGLELDERAWVPAGAAMIVAAGVARTSLAWPGLPAAWVVPLAYALPALLWTGAYALLAWRLGPVLWRRRADGRHGCMSV
ncbi:MAG: NnrS family protein [Candidatus Dactylopiibacterium sp.]|nr:NnrS family protein [Candidatus Dactylopiibacterium sp.]